MRLCSKNLSRRNLKFPIPVFGTARPRNGLSRIPANRQTYGKTGHSIAAADYDLDNVRQMGRKLWAKHVAERKRRH